MTYSTTHGKTRSRLLLFLLVFTGLSCNNSYEYLERSPDWIGDNIYSTLQKDGRFDTYLELLARMDSSYIEVLRRTGSRTLFVPTDSAFAAFFPTILMALPARQICRPSSLRITSVFTPSKTPTSPPCWELPGAGNRQLSEAYHHHGTGRHHPF